PVVGVDHRAVGPGVTDTGRRRTGEGQADLVAGGHACDEAAAFLRYPAQLEGERPAAPGFEPAVGVVELDHRLTAENPRGAWHRHRLALRGQREPLAERDLVRRVDV